MAQVSFTVQAMVQALTGGEGPGLAPWLARMLRSLLRLQARLSGAGQSARGVCRALSLQRVAVEARPSTRHACLPPPVTLSPLITRQSSTH